MNTIIPFLAGLFFGALAAAFITLVFVGAFNQLKDNDNEE